MKHCGRGHHKQRRKSARHFFPPQEWRTSTTISQQGECCSQHTTILLNHNLRAESMPMGKSANYLQAPCWVSLLDILSYHHVYPDLFSTSGCSVDNTDKEFVTLREKPTGTIKKGGDAIAYLDKTSPDGHLSVRRVECEVIFDHLSHCVCCQACKSFRSTLWS